MRLLIFSVENYLGIARLPQALQNAGFHVASLSSKTSYLAKTRFIEKRFVTDLAHGIPKVVHDLLEALQEWTPHLVIPSDDSAFRLMQRIVQLEEEAKFNLPLEILRRSLGDTTHLDEIINKGKFQGVAARIGVQVPAQKRVRSEADAINFAESHGYPVVLKKDYSVSGEGVAICRDEQALVRALRSWMHGRVNRLAKTLLRGFVERTIAGALKNSGTELNLQQYVPGPIGMYATVAVQGKKLGGVAFIKERTFPEDVGPSSVIRSFESAEVEEASSVLMQYFRLTGFMSFDFVLHKDTQHVYLIECNPRPTPVMHLGHRFGFDFCDALFRELNGFPQARTAFIEETVALFPQELRRDPSSLYLKECYHDVPWDDSELIQAYLNYAGSSLQHLQTLRRASNSLLPS